MSSNPCNGCAKSGSCSDTEKQRCEKDQQQQQLQQRLAGIRQRILVMSGKGGVGKSTTAVNLALALARQGKRVGLLDIDLHGPSVPTLLGLEGRRPAVEDGCMVPIDTQGLKVISIGFLTQTADDALIWRGPMKTGVIQQFLRDVQWGELDYLVVDCPPGTGDEPLSIVQLLGTTSSGAVLVTTPQKVALVDVRKSVTFCRQLKLPVYGIVENMSGFVCPKCNEVIDIFKKGGGRQMAADMQVPFLGAVPVDPRMVEAGDAGTPLVTVEDSPTAAALRDIAQELQLRCSNPAAGTASLED
ncbi:Mrp/NBP35 family ATP-binding protein [Desulfuromonas thiophila]|uniref:Iron-sulfur cluster carrier protein n=1 Tax=Desulfuromonas thiophila TaxID=57664 RepID=A0A1G7DE62_9BACT|nr:Mrp/NBP35 family ATP-binding protein [Desulfuromonas thiophila]SDE49729.1 Chromosome partitioning ATPase, Mrp family, contains Fe-S cluster [Desulfuromonas thiophila]